MSQGYSQASDGIHSICPPIEDEQRMIVVVGKESEELGRPGSCACYALAEMEMTSGHSCVDPEKR